MRIRWMCLSLAMLASCGAGAVADRPASPSPSERPTTGTDQPLPAGAPRHVVAITTEETLVVLDATSGKLVRTILPETRDRRLGSLSLSPDGSVAYLERTTRDRSSSQIIAVETDTGSVEVVAAGERPSLSPDGMRLAFTTQQSDPMAEPRIVVRDLRSGDEKRWQREQADHIGGVYIAGWLPDATRLLFGEIGIDPPGSISGVIDVREAGGTLRRSRIGPLYGSGPEDDGSGYGAWEFVASQTTRDVVVAAKMGTGGDSPTRLERMSADTFERIEILVRTDIDVRSLDFDASGEHALVVGQHWMRWRRPSGLFRWHGDRLVPLARQIVDAAW